MNQEAFLPTIGHFCGLPCILLIYDFTEHKGDLVWLIIMLHQASADHYHKLIACWWYTAQLGSHEVRNEPIVWWKKRERSLWSRHLYLGCCLNRLWEVRDVLLIFWWPLQSVSAANGNKQQLSKQVIITVCIPLLRHISFSLLLSHSQAVSVLTTDRRIWFRQIFEPLKKFNDPFQMLKKRKTSRKTGRPSWREGWQQWR